MAVPGYLLVALQPATTIGQPLFARANDRTMNWLTSKRRTEYIQVAAVCHVIHSFLHYLFLYTSFAASLSVRKSNERTTLFLLSASYGSSPPVIQSIYWHRFCSGGLNAWFGMRLESSMFRARDSMHTRVKNYYSNGDSDWECSGLKNLYSAIGTWQLDSVIDKQYTAIQ